LVFSSRFLNLDFVPVIFSNKELWFSAFLKITSVIRFRKMSRHNKEMSAMFNLVMGCPNSFYIFKGGDVCLEN
jgi:hypothetical protein